MTGIALSRRLGRTPYSDAVEAAGVSHLTVYNHTLLAAAFGDVAAEARHLRTAVQLWDVACQRHVRIRGPEADALVQWLTPRDLTGTGSHVCRYVPMVAADGGMLNDPVLHRCAPGDWTVSLADRDMELWIAGLAVGRDVEVFEADLHPLAVQGPLAREVVGPVLGDISGFGFFHAREVEFQGRSLWISRTGFSKQGGIEAYPDAEMARPLWDALMESGQTHGIRVGCPNLIERIEGGMLSCGNDFDRGNTPFECGLGRLCDGTHDYVGRAALEAAGPPRRMIRPVEIADEVPVCDRAWPVVRDGATVGRVTSAVWAPDRGVSVAIGMIDRDAWALGTRFHVWSQSGSHPAHVRDAFWT